MQRQLPGQRRGRAARPTSWRGVAVSADLPLTADELATIRALRLIACDDGPDRTWHERQEAIWLLLDDDGDLMRLVAEIERLQARVARHRLCTDCDATLNQCDRYALGRAIKCCPDCRHPAA